MHDIDTMPFDTEDNNDTISMIRTRLSKGDAIEKIINHLPADMLTKEVVLFAIDNCYLLNENTPSIIKDSPEYLYAYLKENYFGVTTITSLLKYGNQSKFDDKLIKLIVKSLDGAVLEDVYAEGVKITNSKLLEAYVTSRYLNFDTILHLVDESLINEEMIAFLDVNCCTDIMQSLPEFISTDSKYIKTILMHYTHPEIIELCHPAAITDEILYMAVKAEYYLTSYTPSHLRANRRLLEILVEIGSFCQMNRSLQFFEDSVLTKKLAMTAIARGYSAACNQLPKLILNDYDLVYMMVEHNNSYIVNYCNSTLLDVKLVELALDKGYVYTNITPTFVRDNYHLLKYALNGFDVPTSEGYLENFIDYCNHDILDDEVIKLAISKGYCLSNKTPSIIINNRKYVIEILKNNEIRELHSVPLNILTIDDISWIIKHNHESLSSYFFLPENGEYIEKLFKREYDSKIKDKEKFDKIKDKLGYTITTVYHDHCIFSDPVIKGLGVEQACRLFKYTILAGQNVNIESILRHNNIDNLVYAYQIIMRKGIEELDILSFRAFVDFYLKYELIINSLIDMNKLEEYRPKLLRLIDNNYDLDIINIKGLDNINQMIFEYNRRFSIDKTTSNSFQRIYGGFPRDSIKEQIFMLITDHTFSDMKIFLTEIMNSSKAEHMYLQATDTDMKQLLHHYIDLLTFLEFIMNNTDSLELRMILDILNDYSLSNPDKINILVDNYKDIEKTAKCLYGYEANNTLTKLSELKNSSTVKISKNKFSSNKTIEGESLIGRSIDYIEFSGEAYFFAHVMNFCGTDSKISEFKHPRLLGSTYICLSAISSLNGIYMLNRNRNSINGVVLLFDNMDPTSLVYMNDCDIFSSSLDNDLNIISNASDFNGLKETIDKTSDYNEYVFYRENNKGECIYPSAVLVTGKQPMEYEIDAACYLNVPLVKFNPVEVNDEINDKELMIPNESNCPYTYDRDLEMLKAALDEMLNYVSSNGSIKPFRR